MRKTPGRAQTAFRILLVCVIVAVLLIIFFPESRFSIFLRRHFEKAMPPKWRTVHEEQAGRIQVYFGPCHREEIYGIDDILVALIGSAESDIKAAIYNLGLNNVRDALLEAHHRGVAVSLVFYGGNRSSQSSELENAGIKTVYRYGSEGLMHNKFVVVDQKRVWTGSMNFTSNGAYRNSNNGIIIDSEKIASNYTAEFDEMANGFFGAVSPENTEYPKVFIDGQEVETYFGPEDGVQREILSELRAAKEEIVFMAFSFTSVPIAELMALKIAEGVSVRGVFEKSQKSRYSRYDYLRKSGADVLWDHSRYKMHHKVIIIDKRVVIAGSYNFSKSANTRNDENCLIIHSERVAETFLKEFDRIYRWAAEKRSMYPN